MVVLYNEEGNRVKAERSQQSRGKDSPAAKKGMGSKASSGRLVDDQGEINTGRVDSMMNPIFINNPQVPA
jgi:hypothetical protein